MYVFPLSVWIVSFYLTQPLWAWRCFIFSETNSLKDLSAGSLPDFALHCWTWWNTTFYHHNPLTPCCWKIASYRRGNGQVDSRFAHLVLEQGPDSTDTQPQCLYSTRDFYSHRTPAVNLSTGLFMWQCLGAHGVTGFKASISQITSFTC